MFQEIPLEAQFARSKLKEQWLHYLEVAEKRKLSRSAIIFPVMQVKKKSRLGANRH